MADQPDEEFEEFEFTPVDEQFEALMTEAYQQMNVLDRIAGMNKAVARAEEIGERELAFGVRMSIIQAAVFEGHAEVAFPEFDRCLADFDQHGVEEGWDNSHLLWVYKWMVSNALDFPHIPASRIEEMLVDMERRYQAAGNEMRTIYALRLQAAVQMGNPDQAREYGEKWRNAPEDELGDCEACELQHEVDLRIFLGEDEEAIAAAGPILREEESCAEIPHLTFGRLLISYMRLGRIDDAMPYHKKGLRLISQNSVFLGEIGDHMLFMLHCDNRNRAVTTFQRHLPWALENEDQRSRFRFYMAAQVLFEMLTEAGDAPVKLKLPEGFPVTAEEDGVRPSVMAAWLTEQTDGIAKVFDARHGNDYYQGRIEEARQLATVNG